MSYHLHIKGDLYGGDKDTTEVPIHLRESAKLSSAGQEGDSDLAWRKGQKKRHPAKWQGAPRVSF
jgi:hypothetical protein